jgi:hypothetical protein
MRTTICLALAVAAVPGLWAQNVISARSGLIHYAEGNVTLDDQKVKPKNGEFPIVGDGQTLATQDARAEVLLTPGVFLRLGEQSSFKMVSNHLSDTRIELLTGSALIEVDELLKGNSVMVLFHGSKITPLKHGLYRLDEPQNRLRVFDGEAQVIQNDQTAVVKAGHQVEFGAVFLASKFNRKDVDSLDTWAAERSQRIAQANYTAANMVNRGGYSSAYTNSNWVWNPYYGMFTFLPSTGYGYSPYGWMLYSPQTIVYYNAYRPTSYGNNNSGTGFGSTATAPTSSTSGDSVGRGSVSSVGASSHHR